MQPSCLSRSTTPLLFRPPDLGALMSLCEENFRRMLRLAPDIRQASGRRCSSCSGAIDLSMEIQQQTAYMTQLRLTHVFTDRTHQAPDALLRLYYDARQLEVISLSQSLWSAGNAYQPPALIHKWQANLFVAKWLDYCLQQGHRLRADSTPTLTEA